MNNRQPNTIHVRRWHPEPGSTASGQSVYIVHGLGEHSGRYEPLALKLASLGYEVGAHDHPGHGKSTGKRGVVADERLLERVCAEQFTLFANETQSRPVLFGHSLGGVVATNIVLSEQVDARGLILSAPAFAPLISTINRYKVKLLQLIAPNFTQQLPYRADYLTHDVREQEKGSADELNHQYKSAGLITWLINAGRRAMDEAHTLKVKTLLLVPGADAVVDPDAAAQFMEKAPKEFTTLKVYEGFYHEPLNETEERRAVVFADIEAWLTEL